jgi:hypothetical protein
MHSSRISDHVQLKIADVELVTYQAMKYLRSSNGFPRLFKSCPTHCKELRQHTYSTAGQNRNGDSKPETVTPKDLDEMSSKFQQLTRLYNHVQLTDMDFGFAKYHTVTGTWNIDGKVEAEILFIIHHS